MLCGKGASCPFDHASAEVRASREMAVLQQNRLRFAPALSTEADLIAFGRPYISNPDLVERIRNGWPLAEPADMSAWYSPTGAKGYSDFPPYAA